MPPIILTADRTLMAGYRLLFDGMLAASQTTALPAFITERLLVPPIPVRQGRAGIAPLGLRRVEAALLDGGFTSAEVAVTDEGHLTRMIGPETRVIGISSGEPAGQGMSSSTMTGVTGGVILPQALFRRLLKTVHRLKAARAPGAKILLGGPGAWQIAGDDAARAALGIDHVLTGYADTRIAGVMRALLDGEALPAVITGENVPAEAIPPIRGATTMGVIELSRGCGWGCRFCTLARVPMIHLPEETILADARTNLAGGNTSISLLSEDLFRYGGRGRQVNPPALLGLLRRLRELPGLRLIQVDHANIASVARYSDDDLRAVRDLLVGDTGQRYPWVNLGVETASGTLLAENQSAVKLGAFSPEEWGDACVAQVRRLCRAGFMPMISLIVGLPSEADDDIRATLRLVETIAGEPVTVFPVLYAPLDGSPPVGLENLRPLHWQLITTCYDLNFTWVPRLYEDSQRAAGISPARRILLQLLGGVQTAQWKMLFAWHQRKSRK